MEAHARALRRLDLDIEPVEVRRTRDLGEVSGLILPGGESTAMINLLGLNQLWEATKDFAQDSPVWGVCAGAILMAKEVSDPVQVSFEAIDISIERNGYGRQNESFVGELTATEHWTLDKRFEGIFIRAPRIRRMGPGVKSLLEWKGEPVMAEQGLLLVSTFHPELTENLNVHRYFAEKCKQNG